MRGVGVNVDVRTPKQKGGNFEINVRDLNMNYEEIQKRWDPKTRKDFEEWAQKTELGIGEGSEGSVERGNLLGWLKGKIPKPLSKNSPAIYFTQSVTELTDDILKLEKQLSRSQRKLNKTLTTTQGQKEIDELQRKIETSIESAREMISLPVKNRGKVTVLSSYSDKGRTRKTSRPVMVRAERGAEIVQRYVHPDLMPNITVKGNRSRRAYHRGSEKAIYISSKESARVVAHEMMHAVEQQHGLNVPARKYLLQRAAGEEPKRLRQLTGINYDFHEIAFEDEWEKRNGSHYMGKDYGDRATELLTMGMERLDADPIEFAKNDREYFEFMIRMIQKR